MRRAEDAPALSAADVSERISAIVGHEEFLFYRVAQTDDLDWILGASDDGYEMFCTACGQRFWEKRDRKRPAKNFTCCPKCGAEISPKRWRDRACMEAIQFAFHTWTRSEGQDIWFRSYQVRMNRDFENADKYDIFEYCRICFQPGGALKWTRSRNWFEGVTPWEPVKTIRIKRWHGAYGVTRDDVWDGVTEETVHGSCLQYAPGNAVQLLRDPIEFYALFCKYPAVEYVWKMGFERFFYERERYGGADFNRVVNLRAKRPDKLFPKLDKQDLRLLRERHDLNLSAIVAYIKLKQAGASTNRNKLAEWAAQIASWGGDFWQLPERCGTDMRGLLRYCDKQAGRRNVRLGNVLQELRDYLYQLDRLGVDGGDRMPHDLHGAHERLSARERKMKNAPLNNKFRIRRHLLHWMCWKHNGMFIRPVDSADEMTREGEQQQNCVAGYAKRHAEGKTIILLLRKCSAPKESWHTVEIDPVTLTCRQCYAACNTRREPEAATFMDAYLEHLRQVRPSKQKKKRRAA